MGDETSPTHRNLRTIIGSFSDLLFLNRQVEAGALCFPQPLSYSLIYDLMIIKQSETLFFNITLLPILHLITDTRPRNNELFRLGMGLCQFIAQRRHMYAQARHF